MIADQDPGDECDADQYKHGRLCEICGTKIPTARDAFEVPMPLGVIERTTEHIAVFSPSHDPMARESLRVCLPCREIAYAFVRERHARWIAPRPMEWMVRT